VTLSLQPTREKRKMSYSEQIVHIVHYNVCVLFHGLAKQILEGNPDLRDSSPDLT